MALLEQRHTVRWALHDQVVRGRDTTVYAPLYLDGALVAPASGTVSVFDRNRTAVVSAAAVTIAPDIAEYVILAAMTASLPVGDGWSVEWALAVPGARTPDDRVLARNDAMLVRQALAPVVTDADLIRRASALDPTLADVQHSLTNLQAFLDEAWVVIQSRLIEQGNRPNLIMSPSSLREVHLTLALALFYEGHLASRNSDAYMAIADRYRAQHADAWGRLRFEYDADDDGARDAADRRPAVSTLWLSGR